MKLDSALPTSYSRREPRTLTSTDAGVPSALALVLVLLSVPFAFLALTLLDRVVGHLDGPHTVAATRWLAAGTTGLGLAFWFVYRWARDALQEILYTVEEQQTTAQAVTTPEIVNWEMPLGPNQIVRGRLLWPAGAILDWARAAIEDQSLSYATWGERFGGEREYAKFLRACVDSRLGVKTTSGKFGLTRVGFALFSQAVAMSDADATPLLEKIALLQAPGNSEIR